jgi:hypothetical protein
MLLKEASRGAAAVWSFFDRSDSDSPCQCPGAGTDGRTFGRRRRTLLWVIRTLGAPGGGGGAPSECETVMVWRTRRQEMEMMLLLPEAARRRRHLLKLEQPSSLEAACSSGVQQCRRPCSHCFWCCCLQ